MGIFNKKVKEVDMNEEKIRKEFIDKKIAEEKPIMTNLLPQELLEKEIPISNNINKKEEENNISMQKMHIIFEIETDNQELLMQMIDGVSEITENFGADMVKVFKIEKI